MVQNRSLWKYNTKNSEVFGLATQDTAPPSDMGLHLLLSTHHAPGVTGNSVDKWDSWEKQAAFPFQG